MELAPDSLIENRYKVIGPVKSGGMGAVYRVEDQRLAGALCALKVMHPPADLGDHAAVVQRRFQEEMRVLSTLRNPGIPRVLDYFAWQGNRCIVMDFVNGENLEQRVETGALPVDFVLDVAEQVLTILQYLHGYTPPVIHRDIKPANLILEQQTGRIMLVDFGLARTVVPGNSQTQTTAGTLGYAPVEQLQGRAEPRSDLYAVGATMHHLLAGVLPPAINLPPLREVAPDIPPLVTALVDQATRLDPADRFADATAMLEAVRDARRFHPLVQPIPAPVPPPARTPGRERILVVDDNDIVRTVVRRVLESQLYDVIVAEDGQSALQLALEHRPDLIVSDVEMPGLDGVSLVRKLQSYRVTRDIPVLLLTGKTEVSDEALGLEAGAEDYITKPIVPERLVARVQAALRRHMSRS